MWFQRSCVKWFIDGDRNLRYYHLKIVNRRRRNNMLMLRHENGIWIDDFDQLHDIITYFYKDFFKLDHNSQEWSQTVMTYPLLEERVDDKLNATINDEEFKREVLSMSPWEAQGPYGFFAGFHQKSWEVVGNSVCTFVHKVWMNPSEILVSTKLIFV